MPKVLQINLVNGASYVLRANEDEEKNLLNTNNPIYALKLGCSASFLHGSKGISIQLFDLGKNTLFSLPIYIFKAMIVEVKIVLKDSVLYREYLRVTSGIEVIH